MTPADFVILGEDEDFLAVDKPPGLLVHPTRPNGPPTLHDAVSALLGFELATGGQASIVNRLDRETSGVVVIAKHAAAARMAGLEMQARRVSKEYLCLVLGCPEWDALSVDAPILRLGEVAHSPVHLLRAVHSAGQPACTHFEVISRQNLGRFPLSLVRARPITGRTHQIRVHLAHVGFPVIGDKLYAVSPSLYLEFIETGWTPRLEGQLHHSRHALHCSTMSIAGRTWHAGWPGDLAALAPSSEGHPAFPA